jgi:hypothetical protein
MRLVAVSLVHRYCGPGYHLCDCSCQGPGNDVRSVRLLKTVAVRRATAALARRACPRPGQPRRKQSVDARRPAAGPMPANRGSRWSSVLGGNRRLSEGLG